MFLFCYFPLSPCLLRVFLENANRLALSSEHAYISSEQISSTVQQVSQGAIQQAQDATNCVVQMDNLSEDINK